MHNFMCQNVLIFPLFPLYIYYKLEELTHFGLRVLINFSLEIPKHFGLKNHTRKIDKIQRDFALQQAFICTKNNFTTSTNFPPNLTSALPNLYHFPTLH